MRLVAGVVRVTADLERIVKYAFRISPMFGSCSFDFGIWIVAPSVSKMSRSQPNYAASPSGFVTSTNLISCVLIRRSSPSVVAKAELFERNRALHRRRTRQPRRPGS